jgi:hypothetical protein
MAEPVQELTREPGAQVEELGWHRAFVEEERLVAILDAAGNDDRRIEVG